MFSLYLYSAVKVLNQLLTTSTAIPDYTGAMVNNINLQFNWAVEQFLTNYVYRGQGTLISPNGKYIFS